MSSTNRGATRNENDKYITPDYTVDSLLSVLDIEKVRAGNLSFFEPCRATGVIYNCIPAPIKSFAEIDEGIDYMARRFYADFIITNPPFSLAMPFLTKSLSEAPTVIYLLRLNFLGSQKRKAFWQAHRPSHVMVLSKRPSFTGNGTDSIEYAWFAWDKLGLVTLEPGVHVL